MATTLSNIGLTHWQAGNWRKHARYQLRAFAMRKRMGDQIGLADSYTFLAGLPADIGLRNPTYQTEYLRKSITLSRDVRYAWGEQVALQELRTVLRNSLDYWDSSLLQFRAGASRTSGEHRFLNRLRDARLSRRRAEWVRADSLLARVHHLADSLGYYNYRRSTLVRRAQVLVKLGRWDSARAADVLRPLAKELNRRYLEALHETAPESALETAIEAVYGRRASVYGDLVGALKGRRSAEAFRQMERERPLPFWGQTQTGAERREAFRRLSRRLERFDRARGDTRHIQGVLRTLEALRRERLSKRQSLGQTGAVESDLQVATKRALQDALGPEEVFLGYIVGDERYHL